LSFGQVTLTANAVGDSLPRLPSFKQNYFYRCTSANQLPKGFLGYSGQGQDHLWIRTKFRIYSACKNIEEESKEEKEEAFFVA